MKGRRKGRNRGKRFQRMPWWARTTLFYLSLFFLYRFLLRPYVREMLDRELVGVSGVLLVTAVVSGYLLLCCLPPFLWSRSGGHRSFSRGIESYICYVAVFLFLGWLTSRLSDGGVPVSSGIFLGGGTVERIVSGTALFGAFLLASLAGSGGSSGRKKGGRKRLRGSRTG